MAGRLAAVRSALRVRDSVTGRFERGNAGASALRLLELEPRDADPQVRPYLERAQRRFRAAKLSGIYRRTGNRLDGLLRSCILLELQAEVLSAEALKVPPKDARELFAESRVVMREARAALAKLVALVGVRRGDATDKDPLRALAEELGGEGTEGEDDD